MVTCPGDSGTGLGVQYSALMGIRVQAPHVVAQDVFRLRLYRSDNDTRPLTLGDRIWDDPFWE